MPPTTPEAIRVNNRKANFTESKMRENGTYERNIDIFERFCAGEYARSLGQEYCIAEGTVFKIIGRMVTYYKRRGWKIKERPHGLPGRPRKDTQRDMRELFLPHR